MLPFSIDKQGLYPSIRNESPGQGSVITRSLAQLIWVGSRVKGRWVSVRPGRFQSYQCSINDRARSPCNRVRLWSKLLYPVPTVPMKLAGAALTSQLPKITATHVMEVRRTLHMPFCTALTLLPLQNQPSVRTVQKFICVSLEH